MYLTWCSYLSKSTRKVLCCRLGFFSCAWHLCGCIYETYETLQQKHTLYPPPPLKGAQRALCPRCAKSRLFSPVAPVATDPKVLNSAPYTPWYTRDFFFSLMLATGPKVLNSEPPMLFGMDHASFCRWMVFRGVPGINNVIIGAVPALCPCCAKRPHSNRPSVVTRGQGNCHFQFCKILLRGLDIKLFLCVFSTPNKWQIMNS